MRIPGFALILLFCLTNATLAQNTGTPEANKVDVELVLLADASGSIDQAEIQLQRKGYADAITHPKVLNAIRDGLYRRIAVTYVEWGDEFSQEIVVPWTIVDGPESAARVAKILVETPRLAIGPNAIGAAIAFGQALIEGNDIVGSRRVIDFSGDSANNWGGISIADARASAAAGAITINGLAILCRQCNGRPVAYDVEEAFKNRIITGPGSFVVTVNENQSFSEAVLRKFLLEIADNPTPASSGG